MPERTGPCVGLYAVYGARCGQKRRLVQELSKIRCRESEEAARRIADHDSAVTKLSGGNGVARRGYKDQCGRQFVKTNLRSPRVFQHLNPCFVESPAKYPLQLLSLPIRGFSQFMDEIADCGPNGKCGSAIRVLRRTRPIGDGGEKKTGRSADVPMGILE